MSEIGIASCWQELAKAQREEEDAKEKLLEKQRMEALKKRGFAGSCSPPPLSSDSDVKIPDSIHPENLMGIVGINVGRKGGMKDGGAGGNKGQGSERVGAAVAGQNLAQVPKEGNVKENAGKDQKGAFRDVLQSADDVFGAIQPGSLTSQSPLSLAAMKVMISCVYMYLRACMCVLVRVCFRWPFEDAIVPTRADEHITCRR